MLNQTNRISTVGRWIWLTLGLWIGLGLLAGPVLAQDGSEATAAKPVPLLSQGQPVNWWFVFKFNAQAFPGCGVAQATAHACPFGGDVKTYPESQQFVYASSKDDHLAKGGGCLGQTDVDPIGATFGELYTGSFHYVIWNDQFYGDPKIHGCSGNSCSSPWGHSKGVLVWDDAGDGFVMQVTTPSWPASGSQLHPREHDGNTLGCVADDNVMVSQHFFALRLTEPDVEKVLAALANASVVTDPANPQIVNNGGPTIIQNLVNNLGKKSQSTQVQVSALSTGVTLISKPSKLHVPPWQLVSAELGGVGLKAATWWANPKISSTTKDTPIGCWDQNLGTPGPVTIATQGQWKGLVFSLEGGLGRNHNHAKVGVSTDGTHPYTIFGDMNQQGTLDSPKCYRSQNGRGGIFFVIQDRALNADVGHLIGAE